MKNTQNTVVLYHSADMDGIFCREIARKFLPDAELIGWDYGQPKIQLPGDVKCLYVLDLSPECVEGLVACNSFVFPEAQKLIWIDHHKSAIEKFRQDVPGYRIDGVAACRLAWHWFTNIGPDNPISDPVLAKKVDFIDRKVNEPLAVRLAGEYDIWDKRDPRAELFQHGLRSQPLNDDCWRWLLGIDCAPCMMITVVERLLQQGEYIQYSQTEQNASVIKANGFTFYWEGLTLIGCNHARFNSHLFTAGLKPEHDACFGFRWDGKQWTCSLYHAPGKEHIDLSLIAVKYGGGGHRGAAGFRVKDIMPIIQIQ